MSKLFERSTMVLTSAGFVFCMHFAVVAFAGQPPVAPFSEEALARGLVYTMQDYPQTYSNLGFGCGFADLDSDGDEDVVIIGAANGLVGIFENDGTGQFTDRSATSGIPQLLQGSAFTAGDYDADGDLDLYLTQWTLPNVLMRNNGGFQFEDVAGSAGVGDFGEGEAAVFGDYDGDGLLDLYLCNYTGLDLDPAIAPKNKLYHNLGGGIFEDVSIAQTVDDHGYGFQAVWFDYDRDGDVDLYLSNDRGHLPPLFRSNQLWQNDEGQLINVSVGSGADVGLFSMGVACGDFDRNGWPDLYCTNVASYDEGYNPLLLNQGDSTFMEFSATAGVDNWLTSWGSIFFDLNNDGHQDLYVNNMFAPNTLYLNGDSFPCVEIAASANVVASSGASFGSAIADVDGDGDLDLLVNNLSGNVELFINHEGTSRDWIRYRMVGEGGNLFAIGGNTDTRTGAIWQFHEILAGGNGYLGQNELTMHVGLNEATIVDEVVASWPGGQTTRTLTNVPGNETWTLYPPQRLGDDDGDLQSTVGDFLVFADCYDSVIVPGCEMMDFDGNSVIDMDDFVAFQATYDQPLYDCDGNAQNDLLDILLDPGQDLDGSGIPDVCEAGGDLSGDGTVDAGDLALLLGSWGACPGCPADLNGDGTVDAGDLALLLGGWG